MRTKRILSALLAGLLLVGALTACATGNVTDDTTRTQSSETSDGSETELRDNLPDDLNYGNDEITFLSRDRDGWTDREIWVDGINGEPINDAVFERNKAVEERLGVKISNIPDDDLGGYNIVSRVETAVEAGSDEYDVLAAACYITLGQSTKGIFANLRDSEYMDFDKPWWSQGLNDATLYRDNQHVVAGALLLSIYRFAYATVFNQKLFDDAGQKYLYEYVDNGTWTLDKQISLTPLFHRDNGDNIQDEEEDVYGFISTYHISVDPYWSSCEVDILKTNEDGEFEIIFETSKLFDVAEKVLTLYHKTDDSAYIVKNLPYDGHMDRVCDLFAEGKAAMATVRIMGLERENVRSMTDKFGIVPMPKFDETQKEYHSMLHDQFTVISVPTTVKGNRLDEVGAVLEALSSAAYRIVKPVYYEETLRTKIAQDQQSSLMMEQIINSLTTDSGIFYTDALGGFQNPFREIIESKQNTVTSKYRVAVLSLQKKLRTVMLKLDKIASKPAA